MKLDASKMEAGWPRPQGVSVAVPEAFPTSHYRDALSDTGWIFSIQYSV
jgi:hypothetical protein